jgi:hypothetical protein
MPGEEGEKIIQAECPVFEEEYSNSKSTIYLKNWRGLP